MRCKFKMKTLGGFEKRSNTIQFTVLKISLWLLLCGEWIKKGKKLGMERRERLNHISGRPAVRLLRSVDMGLHVILGDASKLHHLWCLDKKGHYKFSWHWLTVVAARQARAGQARPSESEARNHLNCSNKAYLLFVEPAARLLLTSPLVWWMSSS